MIKHFCDRCKQEYTSGIKMNQKVTEVRYSLGGHIIHVEGNGDLCNLCIQTIASPENKIP